MGKRYGLTLVSMIGMEPDIQSVIFMKCPYPDELCNSAATLSDLEFPVDEGWIAVLHCAAGHRFIIGQKVRESE